MNGYRCGILVPWVNTAVEDELRFLPRGIRYHVGRVWPSTEPTDGHDESFMASMVQHALKRQSQFGWLPLDAIYLACTSAAFEDRLRTEDGDTILTVYGCLVEELRQKGVQRVNVASPYSTRLQAALCRALERDGIQIARCTGLVFDGQIRNLRWQDVLQQCKGAGVISKECPLLVVCTALCTHPLVCALEREGVLCISSNSALVRAIRRNAECKAASKK